MAKPAGPASSRERRAAVRAVNRPDPGKAASLRSLPVMTAMVGLQEVTG
jgi:hypothetical protein